MRCRRRERGSGLLIVLLFAAFVAIMLYEEMPVMAFEAERAKEQLLIDRGNQYKQAVKVYWTHFQGRFPPDINALENTNSIRFLRHRYKDPLTGKDDWRLLHMAPGGIGLIDSKVNPVPGVANQNGASTAGGGAFGNQSTTNNSNSIAGPIGSFPGNNSANSQSAPDPNSASGPVIPGVPQRPPAIAANSSPNANTNDPNYDPNDPKNFINANGTQNPGMAAFVNGQPNPNGPQTSQPAQPGSSPNQASANQPPKPIQQIYGQLSNQGVPAQSSGSAFNSQPGIANSTTSAFGSQPGSTSGTSSAFGSNTTLGGMLAGVASIAQGHGIKVVKDQHDYQKWEFWFNPQEANTASGAGGLPGQANPNQNGGNGAAPGQTNSIQNGGNGAAPGQTNSTQNGGNGAAPGQTNSTQNGPAYLGNGFGFGTGQPTSGSVFNNK